jgi:hypothetical protein
MSSHLGTLKSILGSAPKSKPPSHYHLHSLLGTVDNQYSKKDSVTPSNCTKSFVAADPSPSNIFPLGVIPLVDDRRPVSTCKSWSGPEENSLIAAFGHIDGYAGPCDIVYTAKGDQETECHVESLKSGYFSHKESGYSNNSGRLYNLEYHGLRSFIEPRGTAKTVCRQLISLTARGNQSVLVPHVPEIVLAWIVPHGDKSILKYVTKDLVSVRRNTTAPLLPLNKL